VSARVLRLGRIPLTLGALWLALTVVLPVAMSAYAPYVVRPGIRCVRTAVVATANPPFPEGMCAPLAELYHMNAGELLLDASARSLALLLGAAVLALVLGTLLGLAAALLRHRAWASVAIIGMTTLVTAVPAFFIAYFLQILVILVGATSEGSNLLPVFGFGYDAHVVLPLLSVSAPAIAYTAQLTATRAGEVLDADFIAAARARGLPELWIIRIHVLPHVRPTVLEALGSGLRISVASLPIIEYLFVWRGLGQLALEAVGVHDVFTLAVSAIVLATLFTTLSAIADVSRPRALYESA
jgi:peptide/nickel transport system permease protein